LVGYLAFADVTRILVIEILNLNEAPVDWAIGKPAMIGRVEIGRDILDIPGHFAVQEEDIFRR
jgi:hypothetical protein